MTTVLVTKEDAGHRNRERACFSCLIIYVYPGVAQLVARLLWEQDAASSSLATWTKSPESASAESGLLCLYKAEALASAFLLLLCFNSLQDVSHQIISALKVQYILKLII